MKSKNTDADADSDSDSEGENERDYRLHHVQCIMYMLKPSFFLFFRDICAKDRRRRRMAADIKNTHTHNPLFGISQKSWRQSEEAHSY